MNLQFQYKVPTKTRMEKQEENETQVDQSYEFLGKKLVSGFCTACDEMRDNYAHLRAQFQQLKGWMENVLRSHEELKARNQLFAKELAKYDQNHELLGSSKEINVEINPFEKQAQQGKKQMAYRGFQLKPSAWNIKPKKSAQQGTIKARDVPSRQNFERQSHEIINFIQNYLSRYLIFDKTKENKIPKGIIVNLYMKWCKLKNRTPLIRNMLVKMQLTNELKNMYPEIEHNGRVYIGIMFKSDLVKIENAEGVKREPRGGANGLKRSRADRYRLDEEKMEGDEIVFPQEEGTVFDDVGLDSIKFEGEYDEFQQLTQYDFT